MKKKKSALITLFILLLLAERYWETAITKFVSRRVMNNEEPLLLVNMKMMVYCYFAKVKHCNRITCNLVKWQIRN